MNSAVVQISDNIVVNIIVADPSIDPAPDGYLLIGLPENSPVTFGWVYNLIDGTFSAQIQALANT
jgi:hypothetical protein